MNKLKEVRLARGMSQTELARKSGVSRATIILIEKNPNRNTSTRTLEELAKALDCTVFQIFFGQDG